MLGPQPLPEQEAESIPTCADDKSRGEAIGAEVFVQRRLTDSPWYGQAALSLNRTRFTGLDGTRAPGAFDTPVLANVLVGWRPSARWEIA